MVGLSAKVSFEPLGFLNFLKITFPRIRSTKLSIWKVQSFFSQPPKRGYPCGLWTTFHFLLANTASDDAIGETLNVIVDIVINFFGCEHCVENFKKEIQEFPYDLITTIDDGVLWLWKLHNSGNFDLFCLFRTFEFFGKLIKFN